MTSTPAVTQPTVPPASPPASPLISPRLARLIRVLMWLVIAYGFYHWGIDRPAGYMGDDYLKHLNPKSLEVISEAKLEPALSGAEAGQVFQFERLGYFSVDPDSASGTLVFNRTTTLKDTWAREQAKGE